MRYAAINLHIIQWDTLLYHSQSQGKIHFLTPDSWHKTFLESLVYLRVILIFCKFYKTEAVDQAKFNEKSEKAEREGKKKTANKRQFQICKLK